MQYTLTTKFNFGDKVFVTSRKKDNHFGIAAAKVERIRFEILTGGSIRTEYFLWKMADRVEGETDVPMSCLSNKASICCWFPENEVFSDLDDARKRKEELNALPF